MSYEMPRWRGSLPFKAFDVWMCGSIADAAAEADIYEIVTELTTEDGEPLPVEIITAPVGGFPLGARVNRLDLFLSAAVFLAPGLPTIQTNPKIDIFISKDLGISWGNAWYRMRSGGRKGYRPMSGLTTWAYAVRRASSSNLGLVTRFTSR